MNFFANLSIRNKILVSFLAIMLLTTLIISISIVKIHSDYSDDYLKKTYSCVAKTISEQLMGQVDLPVNSEEINRALKSQLDILEDVENAQVFNQADSLVAVYNKGNALWEKQKVEKNSKAYYQDDYLYVIEPGIYKNKIRVIVYLKVSTKEHTLIELKFIRNIIFVLIGSSLMILFVVILLQRYTTTPLVKLTENIQEITQEQKFNQKIQTPKGNDEITELYNQFSIMLDTINKREQERDAAKKKEEFTNEIFTKVNKASFDAIIVADNEQRIKFFNVAAEKLFGYKFSEIKDNSFINLIVPFDKRESSKESFSKILATGQSVETFETKSINKNNESFDSEVSINSYKYEDKSGVVITVKDITERKKREKELVDAKNKAEESDKLKSAFLANMSHEIRTPMNSILGFSTLLTKPGVYDKHKEQYLELIINSGKSLLNLINDIIDISKIEAGQLKVKPRKITLNPLMNEVYMSHYQINDMKNKSFELRMKKAIETDDFSIETDPFRLKQILNNLIGNAMKFTEKGYIEFGYKFNNPEQLLFYVKDTGVGMPADKLNLIFQRFGQIEQKDDKNQSGTGLGLTISKKLAELLGGQMWVESTEGEGSTFFFTLPYDADLNTGDEYGASLVEDGNGSLENKTLLVAEDEEMNIVYMKEILADTKANVLWAKNGEEAVKLAKENPSIDLILMDIKMPVMNGYEATQKIREFNKNVIIIAQTAYALTGEKEKTIEAGCNYYITKPIEIKILMNTIQGFLNRKKS
ncbi:MAG: response regulator [Bacteroidales bacterium]|nr:response regulator [Bacteroidales bacterium]